MPHADADTVLAILLNEDLLSEFRNADTLPAPSPCAVTGCPWYAAATDVETLADYCPAHLDEWLAAEGDS